MRTSGEERKNDDGSDRTGFDTRNLHRAWSKGVLVIGSNSNLGWSRNRAFRGLDYCDTNILIAGAALGRDLVDLDGSRPKTAPTPEPP